VRESGETGHVFSVTGHSRGHTTLVIILFLGGKNAKILKEMTKYGKISHNEHFLKISEKILEHGVLYDIRCRL